MHLFFSLSLISFGQAHKIYPAENHQNLLQMHIFCLHICSALNIIERKKKKRKKSAIDKGSLPAHCRSSGSSTHDPDDIFWAPTTAGFFQILSQNQVLSIIMKMSFFF